MRREAGDFPGYQAGASLKRFVAGASPRPWK